MFRHRNIPDSERLPDEHPIDYLIDFADFSPDNFNLAVQIILSPYKRKRAKIESLKDQLHSDMLESLALNDPPSTEIHGAQNQRRPLKQRIAGMALLYGLPTVGLQTERIMKAPLPRAQCTRKRQTTRVKTIHN